METLERVIGTQRVFAELAPEHLAVLTGCARNHRFTAGQYLCREGLPANEFFIIRQGRAALEIAPPARHAVVLETLGPGDVAGASWLIPPYRWSADIRAVETTLALGIDAACLRSKCETDHDFGYAMMKCFLPMLVQSLNAARLQVLDVYAGPYY
ncbi:cyclic nucleotide-binding domain-containing protein [Acidocella aromatica]|uniref:CRP-like cAMP-binding protein n=1 Tax=Acidocella aromatica TaxID=1303579 RepID=A0A840VNE5_9PROT|nr:cyclic nucleotide-binding domain-containing protein [Acidocella aromatica]MBB5373101.1 CRP-like cAMP-binding protein [Acidocella aromatica]